MENKEEKNNKEVLDKLEMKWSLRNAINELSDEGQREKVMEYIAQKQRKKIYSVEFNTDMDDTIGLSLTDEEAEYVKSRLTEIYMEAEADEDDYADGVFRMLNEFRGEDKRIDELIFDECDEVEVIPSDDFPVEPSILYLDHYCYCPKFTVVPISTNGEEAWRKPYKYQIGMSDEDYATLLLERIKDDRFNYNLLVVRRPELAAKLTKCICFPSIASPMLIDYRCMGVNTLFTILFDEVEEDLAAMAEWWKK